MFENIMFKVQKVRFMFIQARCDVFGSPERTGTLSGVHRDERHRETLRGRTLGPGGEGVISDNLTGIGRFLLDETFKKYLI